MRAANLSIKSRVVGKLIDTVIADAEVADVRIYFGHEFYRGDGRRSRLRVEVCSMVEMLCYDGWDGVEELTACSTDVVEVGHLSKRCGRDRDLERGFGLSCWRHGFL
jgi:hypothetical protein